MAFDKSQVNNPLIFKLMAASFVTLVGLKFALDSYFTYITEDAKANAAASPEALIKLRADEKKALASAQTPIVQALGIVGKSPRERASLIVRPLPSDDVAAMKGWSKMPKAFDPALSTLVSAPAAVAPVGALHGDAVGESTPAHKAASQH